MGIYITSKNAEKHGRHSQNNLFVMDLPVSHFWVMAWGTGHHNSQNVKHPLFEYCVYHCVSTHSMTLLGLSYFEPQPYMHQDIQFLEAEINRNIQFSDHLLVTDPASPDFVGQSSSFALALRRRLANPSSRLHK
jgi:hypothetical protein